MFTTTVRSVHMYRARTLSTIVVFLLMALQPGTTAGADWCMDHDPAAIESYQRAVIQAESHVMIRIVENTPELESFARATLQAQGQVMVPATSGLTVEAGDAVEAFQRATLQAQGQVFVEASAHACLTSG
jgi:hypothetical protein